LAAPARPRARRGPALGAGGGRGRTRGDRGAGNGRCRQSRARPPTDAPSRASAGLRRAEPADAGPAVTELRSGVPTRAAPSSVHRVQARAVPDSAAAVLAAPPDERPEVALRAVHDGAVHDGAGLAVVREAAVGCRACDLWAKATQTVFGQG